jgi:Xaa-Pro dipeptidase
MTDYSKMELTGLPTSFFEPNRAKLFDLVPKRISNFEKDSVLILKAGDEVPKYDTDVGYYYFFQEANFYYFTGVTEAGLNAALDFKNNEITLFYEQPDDTTKIWQTVVTKDEMADKYKLKVVDKKDMNEWLFNRNPVNIHKLEGVNDTSGLDVISVTFNFDGKYESLNSKIKSEPNLYFVIKECRKEKTPEEQELMKFICKTTNEAHKEIYKAVKAGKYERDVENAFNCYCSEKFYTRVWGYPCIGGCGVNGATLHYEINNKICKDGELFLADMGMRFCNYVSDVTITCPVNGKFSAIQKDIYDLVFKANREIMQTTKPGANFKDMDLASKRIIVEGLQLLGFINKGFTSDELMKKRVWYYFYPHRLGHYVGIEVHDVYVIKYDKDTDLLKEGNVITIEPGIYFRDFLLEKGFNDPYVSKYLNEEKCRQNFNFGGVRIEDDVLVTKDGYINMNEELPRTTDEIEAFMK